MTTIDHLLLDVNDAGASTRFYTDVLGFDYEGHDRPLHRRARQPGDDIAARPEGTDGGQHLAFSLPAAAFARVKPAGLRVGGIFHDATNMRGPGDENGAQGPGKAILVSRFLVFERRRTCTGTN